MSVDDNGIRYCSKSLSKSNEVVGFRKPPSNREVNHYQNSTFKSKTSFTVMGFQYFVLNKEKEMGRIKKLKNLSKGVLGFWLKLMAYYGSS